MIITQYIVVKMTMYSPFHGGNTSSILVGVIRVLKLKYA